MELTRPIASESPKTQKARAKLRERFSEQDELVNQEALTQTAEKIRRWISSHSHERVRVRKKTIDLSEETSSISQAFAKFPLQF